MIKHSSIDTVFRITTVPLSLDKLLEGQLKFMSSHYKVHAISSDQNYLDQIAIREGVDSHCIKLTRKITPFQDLWCIIKLLVLLKKHKPHIVHTHTPKAGMVGMLAAWLARVPNRLHTVAGMPLMESTGSKRKVLLLVERITYACAHKVYPNSRGLYSFIKNEKLAPSTKLKVLGNGSSNGIDTTYFSKEHFRREELDDLKDKMGISSKDFVLTFVGRVVKDKGINELVEAFVQLAETNKDLKLLIVGPFEQELNPIAFQTLNYIKQHPQIIHTGFQKDVRPFLAITDLFVFPSYREGFPNVVMQAGAMGVPCVVSDINGCNEIIIHKENGWIIPVKSKEAIVNAVNKIYDDRELLSHMRLQAREYIVSRYERKYFWELLLKEYHSLEKE